MLTETSVVGSDDWMLMELATEMGQDFARLNTLRKYREGDAPVPDEATASMRNAYKSVVERARLHVADLIVTAKTNRQKPLGFRTAVAGDEDGDDAAWLNWKRSHMPVKVRDLFNDVGHYGTGYITTTGQALPTIGEDLTETYGAPKFVVSNGWTTHSRQLAAAQWLAEAAITIGYDAELGADKIILYRRGYMRIALKPTTKTTIPTDGSQWNPGNDWTWTSDPISLNFTPDCPVVRLDAPDGVGIYEKHTDSLDRINDEIKNRLVIVAMQSFRQRAIKGDLPAVYPDDHPQAGQEVDYNEIYQAGPAALWLMPAGSDIWESQPTDITPILNATKDDLKHLASVTNTPLYVLQPDAAAGSAEGASVMREGLTFSVEDLNDRAGDAFATAHALAFAAQRDSARADAASIETIWANIDRASLLEKAQAAAQAKAGGMPQRMIDEKVWGLTPAEIRQARQDRQDEAFESALTATA